MAILRLPQNILEDCGLEKRVKEEQRRQSIDTLRRLAEENFRPGDDTSIKAIYDALIDRDIDKTSITQTSSQIRDILNIKLEKHEFSISYIVFPKGNGRKEFSFSVAQTEISQYIPLNNTPESIADFILAVRDYLPEYCEIEKKVMVREKQNRIARELAMDLLQKNICNIAVEKGYESDVIGSIYNDNAQVMIHVSNAIKIKIDVNLLDEDMFNQITKLVKALPEMAEI